MPLAAPRPCPKPGCPKLIRGKQRYCVEHGRVVSQARGSSAKRGYTWRWRQVAKLFLLEHPLCECRECQAGKVRVIVATVVDHRIPHRGDETLFWDQSNWQAMAKVCHDKKTASEDGGFGHS